jgi:hypothetical protein
MIPVRLPFATRIVDVNEEVRLHPEALVTEPYDEGWLFEAQIDPNHLDACRVMACWTAEKQYIEDEKNFIETIIGLERTHTESEETTIYDGGDISADALHILGSARYCSVLSYVYCKTS